MVIEHKANEERYACIAENRINYAYQIAETKQTEREGHKQQRGSEKLSVFVYAGKCSSVWLTTAHMDERHAPNMPKPINKLYATLSVG